MSRVSKTLFQQDISLLSVSMRARTCVCTPTGEYISDRLRLNIYAFIALSNARFYFIMHAKVSRQTYYNHLVKKPVY
jgi:hypothetical protein